MIIFYPRRLRSVPTMKGLIKSNQIIATARRSWCEKKYIQIWLSWPGSDLKYEEQDLKTDNVFNGSSAMQSQNMRLPVDFYTGRYSH